MRRAALALSVLSLTAACTTMHSASHPPASSPVSPSSSPPAGNATLTGLLLAVGGAPPGSPRLLPGSVTITGPVTQHVVVGTDGKYQAVLPVGTYTVTGTSPQFNDGATNCRIAGATVTLKPGRPVVADVMCEEK